MKQLLPAVVALLVLGSCSHAARKAAPRALGIADSGKTIEMMVGQATTLRLDWNPSTGYLWQTVTDPDPRVLMVVDTGYGGPAANMPGTTGQAWWKLRATGTGSTSLVLRYVRPWEPEAKDAKAKEFTLKLDVK